MSTLLEIQNLKKYFKTPRGMLHAVDDVSFAIDQGCTMGIVGESGCGKSTLGRTIAQLLQPTGGRILFSSQDVSRLKRSELKASNRNIQMIFQDPFSSLNPRMTVFDAIAEPLRSQRISPPRGSLREEAAFQMHYVGLDAGYLDRYPPELSGGQRQRVAIARALAMEPELLVADEPIASLDVSIQAQIVNLFKHLQQEHGFSFLFIAHDLAMVEFLCDRVGVMYRGRLVEAGPAAEVFAHPGHPYTRALLSSIPIPDPRRERARRSEIFSGEALGGRLAETGPGHYVLREEG